MDADSHHDRPLRWTTAAFVVGSLVHAADHQRRGMDVLTGAVQVLGYAGLVVTALIAVTVFRRHPVAPLIAFAGGSALVVGFVAVHWLPDWGPISDTLVTGDAGWRSRFASLLEIVTAAAMVVAASLQLRRDRLVGV